MTKAFFGGGGGGAYTQWGLFSGGGGGVIHGRKIALRSKGGVFS